MKQIIIHDFYSTQLDSDYLQVNKLEIDDTTIGRGGFGKVYGCTSVGGRKPGQELVVKLFANLEDKSFETIRSLQEKLKNENERFLAMGSGLIAAYPALIAVPQFSFRGEMSGEPVIGYTSTNLISKGFQELKDMLAEDDEVFWEDIYWNVRLRIAYDLFRTFGYLWKQLKFIHADIKEDALFVDKKNGCYAIIDFDGGAILDNASSKTTTVGGIQDWMAPEILSSIKSGQSVSSIDVNLYTDTWSITIAAYHILFGTSPFYFLKEVSFELLQKYLSSFSWPDFDFNTSIPVAEIDQESLDFFRDEYENNSPEEIKKAFQVTFNQGFKKPSNRYTFDQWCMQFSKIEKPPTITEFRSDMSFVERKQEITFVWDVKSAFIIKLEGIDVTNEDSFTLTPTADKRYHLEATNYFGQKTDAFFEVLVSKEPPEINFFKADTYLRSDDSPIKLAWSVSTAERLYLLPNEIDITGKTDINVFPLEDTEYVFVAESFFGITNEARLLITTSKEPAQIHSFHALPPTRENANPVKLQWSVENAESLTLIEGDKNHEVSEKSELMVSPLRDTVYTLQAATLFGVLHTKDLKVEVCKDAPNVKVFAVTPPVRTGKEPLSLSWEVEGAECVEISPEVGIVSNLGSTVISPLSDTEYTLKATSFFGVDIEQKVVAKVSKEPPEIHYFRFKRAISKEGDKNRLIWKVNGQEKVLLDDIECKGEGQKIVKMKKTKIYKLEAQSLFGVKATAHAKAIVLNKPKLRIRKELRL